MAVPFVFVRRLTPARGGATVVFPSVGFPSVGFPSVGFPFVVISVGSHLIVSPSITFLFVVSPPGCFTGFASCRSERFSPVEPFGGIICIRVFYVRFLRSP